MRRNEPPSIKEQHRQAKKARHFMGEMEELENKFNSMLSPVNRNLLTAFEAMESGEQYRRRVESKSEVGCKPAKLKEHKDDDRHDDQDRRGALRPNLAV